MKLYFDRHEKDVVKGLKYFTMGLVKAEECKCGTRDVCLPQCLWKDVVCEVFCTLMRSKCCAKVDYEAVSLSCKVFWLQVKPASANQPWLTLSSITTSNFRLAITATTASPLTSILSVSLSTHRWPVTRPISAHQVFNIQCLLNKTSKLVELVSPLSSFQRRKTIKIATKQTNKIRKHSPWKSSPLSFDSSFNSILNFNSILFGVKSAKFGT